MAASTCIDPADGSICRSPAGRCWRFRRRFRRRVWRKRLRRAIKTSSIATAGCFGQAAAPGRRSDAPASQRTRKRATAPPRPGHIRWSRGSTGRIGWRRPARACRCAPCRRATPGSTTRPTAITTAWSPCPTPPIAEPMWLDDAVYDLLVVIGYNMRPGRPRRRQRHLPAHRPARFLPDRGLHRGRTGSSAPPDAAPRSRQHDHDPRVISDAPGDCVGGRAFHDAMLSNTPSRKISACNKAAPRWARKVANKQ